MIEEGIELVKRLKPPGPNASTAQINDHLWFVSILMGVMFVGFSAHILLACGMIPGYAGFAMASDTIEVKEQTKLARLEYLEGRAFELRINQCDAIAKGKSPLVYTTQLQIVIRTYEAITNKTLNLPTCQEVT